MSPGPGLNGRPSSQYFRSTGHPTSAAASTDAFVPLGVEKRCGGVAGWSEV